MDLKTAGALRRLRLVSTPEAVSFLLLLVCSVLKRTTDVSSDPDERARPQASDHAPVTLHLRDR